MRIPDRNRHLAIIGFAALLALGASAAAQGPVVLMGIDAEDGNGAAGSAHGGKAPYISVLSSILTNVGNGGSGVLVIGGGKNAGDDVTTFWQIVAAGATPAQAVTNVNGAAIATQSFAGFAVIAVASSSFGTFSGGLTAAENAAFTTRAADVANFVNGGGGLFGTSQDGLPGEYGYLGSLGAFTFNHPPQFQDVTATPQGLAVGITSTNLDVCCWHDQYLTFPGFLDVLATNVATGQACAIGGSQVIIVQGIVLTPLVSSNPVGTPHTVTATVANNFGNPVVGTLVTFNVISGPNTGANGTGVTNASGQATFTYTGGATVGLDTIQACFIDQNLVQHCALATKDWFECMLFIGTQPASTPLNPPMDYLRVGDIFMMIPVTMENRPVFNIPVIPSLYGAHVYFQVGMYNPIVFPNDPLQLSNGVDLMIGGFWSVYGGGTTMTCWIEEQQVPLGGTCEPNFSIAGFGP